MTTQILHARLRGVRTAAVTCLLYINRYAVFPSLPIRRVPQIPPSARCFTHLVPSDLGVSSNKTWRCPWRCEWRPSDMLALLTGRLRETCKYNRCHYNTQYIIVIYLFKKYAYVTFMFTLPSYRLHNTRWHSLGGGVGGFAGAYVWRDAGLLSV